MTAELVAPAVLAVAASALSGWLRRRLPPRAGVILLTLVAVASATAVVWGLSLVVVGGLLGVPQVPTAFAWCERALRAGHQAHPVVGAVAGAFLAVGSARLVWFERSWRRTVRRHSVTDELTVVDTEIPIAYALPGRRGAIVVSRGLLDMLEERETTALLAHERCHLHRRHDRYLRAAGAAAAVVPFLAPLARHVRFATEREADEAAAYAVGDRTTVARAIATAALGPRIAGALAAGGHGVPERVDELLHQRRPAWLPVIAVLVGLGVLFVGLSTTTIQLHHLLAFSLHVCGLD